MEKVATVVLTDCQRELRLILSTVALLMDRDSHVSEGVPQIYDLFCACSCGSKLQTKGGSLNGTLFLGVPVDWHLVGKMEDACDRSPHDNVMVEVGIDKV